MKKFKYDGIAPSRNPFDPVYLQFIRVIDGKILYKKALRWIK